MSDAWYDHWVATETVRDSGTVREVRRLHREEWGNEPDEGVLRHYLYRLAFEEDRWQGRADLARIIERHPLPPPPPPPAIQRLHRSGRWLRTEDEARFLWRGMSGFGLLYRLRMSEDDVALFLDRAQEAKINVVRVLTTAVHLFDLHPDVGVAYLPRLCELAAERGIYIEAVALADSQARSYAEDEHLIRVRGLVATCPNLLVEGGNELEPLHPTQRPDAREAALKYATVPGGVYAQGSTHNGLDESSALAGGDYVPVHFDRSDGEEGWRWVRHTKEGWNLSESTGKFVVNDESRRDDLNVARQFALGALCRICGMGDTFHYDGGRYWDWPIEDAALAREQRRHGWDIVGKMALDDGVFKNATWSDGPIRSFNTNRALRCYSRVNGDWGMTLVLRCNGEPEIEWQHGWHPVRDVGVPTAKLFEIVRS